MCDTTARVVYIVDMWSKLCAQAGESAGVGDVRARLVSATATASTGFAAATTTLATTTSTAELATTFAATAASFAATEFTAAATTTLATAASSLTTTTSASTTLTRRRGEHTIAIELDVDLFLALTFTLGLGSLAGHVGLLLFLTGHSLALGEFLAATLVGLADVLSSKGKLLLSLLNKVGSVGLAPVFRLRLGLVLGLSSISDSVLLFGLCNGLASFLVFELSVAVVAAPAVSSLLLLLAVACQC